MTNGTFKTLATAFAKGTPLGRYGHDSINLLIPEGFGNDASDPIQNLWIAQKIRQVNSHQEGYDHFQTVACKDPRRFLWILDLR